MARGLHSVGRVRLCISVVLVLSALGCNGPIAESTPQPAPGPASHESVIESPSSLTSIELPEEARARVAQASPPDAQPLRVACRTCHDGAPDRPLPKSPEDLNEFHRGLVFRHGELACASCHSQGQPPRLHLATGEALETSEALRLCAQCHGPQWRDFQHGAHGGMRGYWDLSRGPRTRVACVACHDPHAPRYVGGLPVLPPRDRLLQPRHERGHERGEVHP